MVAQITQEASQSRSANRVINQFDLCIIGVNDFRTENSRLHQLIQWLTKISCGGKPTVNRAAADVDAVPREDVFLAIPWQVVKHFSVNR